MVETWDQAAARGLKELAVLEAKEKIHDELPKIQDLKLPILSLSEQLEVSKKIIEHYQKQNYRVNLKLYTPAARFKYLNLFGASELSQPVYDETGNFVLPASNSAQILVIQNLIYYQKVESRQETKIAFQLTWDQELAINNPVKLHQNYFQED
ncbi:hypothetical protein [Xylocopilactobacillus apicola]|uniref:Uncharacterized protein n=1 Tax=Xylocopilactobacillus apicola TaxID=2932184 RepID=A0AAU9D669_9LACO|nr:hypothetical protein [Xylocopilactobacillus apicola]BDR59319.1 hypothetical protein XA3_17600 [Xylocopilactobacillus apicola]